LPALFGKVLATGVSFLVNFSLRILSYSDAQPRMPRANESARHGWQSEAGTMIARKRRPCSCRRRLQVNRRSLGVKFETSLLVLPVLYIKSWSEPVGSQAAS
jgi:hypothetical protein